MIPLLSLGVVDIAANDVHENEILAHALHNVNRSEKREGWAVRCGSLFVNELLHHSRDALLTWDSIAYWKHGTKDPVSGF